MFGWLVGWFPTLLTYILWTVRSVTLFTLFTLFTLGGTLYLKKGV